MNINGHYQSKDNAVISKLISPLFLCGYNSANFDLYFFVRMLMNSKYSERFATKCIFKGGSLVSFMLFDNETGRIALKSHDICQITLGSLDKACESYLGEKLKGKFPHLFINKHFFNTPDILNT